MHVKPSKCVKSPYKNAPGSTRHKAQYRYEAGRIGPNAGRGHIFTHMRARCEDTKHLVVFASIAHAAKNFLTHVVKELVAIALGVVAIGDSGA